MAKIKAEVTFYVENMPGDDHEADTYADEHSERIAELLEGINGTIEGSVSVIEWDEVPEEVTSMNLPVEEIDGKLIARGLHIGGPDISERRA
jgi:hypothetical protein